MGRRGGVALWVCFGAMGVCGTRAMASQHGAEMPLDGSFYDD